MILSIVSVTDCSELYSLSLHDALPIYWVNSSVISNWIIENVPFLKQSFVNENNGQINPEQFTNLDALMIIFFQIPISYFVTKIDRKSTRLNSSHVKISYAVFCLKKKKQ